MSGFAFTLLALNPLWVAFPLAILAAVFGFVRVQRGEPLGLPSGITAYLTIMLAASAVLFAFGAGFALTALIAGIDEGFAYGAPNAFSPAGIVTFDDQQNADLGRGLGLLMVAVLLAMAHVALRARAINEALLDDGLESAVEVLVAIFAAVVALIALGLGLGSAFERAFVDASDASPGGELAFGAAFAVVWLLYGARVLLRIGWWPATNGSDGNLPDERFSP